MIRFLSIVLGVAMGFSLITSYAIANNKTIGHVGATVVDTITVPDDQISVTSDPEAESTAEYTRRVEENLQAARDAARLNQVEPSSGSALKTEKQSKRLSPGRSLP
jgi:hypothetical protein